MPYAIRKLNLEFHRPFTISHGTRTHTPAVFLELEHEGVYGFGEAALPPYLPETQDSVFELIRQHEHILSGIHSRSEVQSGIRSIAQIPGGNAARACMEMAIVDLSARLEGVSASDWLGINPGVQPECSFTLSAGPLNELESDLVRSKGFNLLKVKLTGADDIIRVAFVRERFKGMIAVDVNMGWKDPDPALQIAAKLKDLGVIFIEQPFHKDNLSAQEQFFRRSPLPVIADEAIRTYAELERTGHCYHGVNIKLMKSPGITESIRMMRYAKKLGMKVLIGCMSESSCGVGAAAAISREADWCDLDGPMLIRNDPFTGIRYVNGKICVEGKTGTGVKKRMS